MSFHAHSVGKKSAVILVIAGNVNVPSCLKKAVEEMLSQKTNDSIDGASVEVSGHGATFTLAVREFALAADNSLEKALGQVDTLKAAYTDLAKDAQADKDALAELLKTHQALTVDHEVLKAAMPPLPPIPVGNGPDIDAGEGSVLSTEAQAESIEFTAGAALRRAGQPLPDDASDSAKRGYQFAIDEEARGAEVPPPVQSAMAEKEAREAAAAAPAAEPPASG